VGTVDGGSLTNCYTDVSVSGVSYAGGVIGSFTHGSLTDCYAIGPVANAIELGGLVGSANTTVGVLPTLTGDYFDQETTDQSAGVGDNASASGATGESTPAMQQQATYAGWDFTDVWGIATDVNDGYPYLRWQQLSPPAGQLPETPVVAALPVLLLAGMAFIWRRQPRPA
jgi:hypothetical protein